jgi:hypothetical protein
VCDNRAMAKRKITERYGRWAEADRSFDKEFWQRQGDLAIFEAVRELIRDYWLLHTGNADEPRLQRTVERFERA